MNTQSNPKTIFQVPGPYSSIMPKIAPNPITPASTFHASLMSARTKGQIIDVLCKRGSSMGWFSDMPDGLWDKLETLRNPPKR